jgi:hypothetical protein
MTIAETITLGLANLGGPEVFDPRDNKYTPPELPYPTKDLKRSLHERAVQNLHEAGKRAWDQLRAERPRAGGGPIGQG